MGSEPPGRIAIPEASRFFVVGASGNLGRLAVEGLLAMVPAGTIVAGARDPRNAAAMALEDRGVEIRPADYDRPETLDAALIGIDRLMLVSGGELGQRTRQDRARVDAAKRCGVGVIVYTSILHADTSPLSLSEELRATVAATAAARA